MFPHTVFTVVFVLSQLISDSYLGLFTAQLQAQGYSVFVVQGALPALFRGGDVSIAPRSCWHSLSDILTAPPPAASSGKSKPKARQRGNVGAATRRGLDAGNSTVV